MHSYSQVFLKTFLEKVNGYKKKNFFLKRNPTVNNYFAKCSEEFLKKRVTAAFEKHFK